MKLTRVYCPNRPLNVGADWCLDDRGMRHIVQVMRLRRGDKLVVFNDDHSGDYLAEIVATTKKEARIRITERNDAVSSPIFPIHLAQAVSRGERMDYAIQKAVELGVSEITPILTERCGVKVDADRQRKRHAHWRGVAISAAEQSGRCEVPIIHMIQRLDAWLGGVSAELKWVAAPGSEIKPAANIESPDSFALLIGPEGGLTSSEIQQSQSSGFDAVSLGPRTLRTETAPVVAITLAQYLFGDL